MKRHWTHWFNYHWHCHPARCRKAADMCNAIEAEQALADYYHDKEGWRP